jgi:zinc transport system ATP-binding protein
MTVDLVTLRDVSVELGGNPILRGVTTQLARGKITALIGLNGSGKTTLLRAILREVPCSGQIAFHCGHDHTRPTPQHVGYVPQRLRIEANMPLTVRDLLALALQRRPLFLGISRRIRRVMVELLERVWMSADLLDRPVEKLSGGEMQRVLLALALQPDPELLLLDEPASGIDFQHEKKFYDLIAELNRRTGVTILLVSHELSVVSEHAHHVLCLKDGRIHCEGPPHKILLGETLSETFGQEKGVYAHLHGPRP